MASLPLQQVREIGTATTREDVTMTCSCKILFYIVSVHLHTRKLRLCRGQPFLNAVKILLFISDVQFYVPIKLCKMAGSIHFFKITGMLKPENVK